MSKSIFRVQKDKENPYVMINKQFVNDATLTMKAKGLLTFLLSLPDDWKVYEDEIVKHFKDGKASVRSAIKELISTGYIERERIRNSIGQLNGYNYYVYEVPTMSENQKMDNPLMDNSTLLSNNSTNNKVTDMYMNLPINGHSFFRIYNFCFHNKFGKDHMKITQRNIELAEKVFSELREYDVNDKRFSKAVEEHLSNLPKSNNGNIMAFLKASKRHFDIDVIEIYREHKKRSIKRRKRGDQFYGIRSKLQSIL